MFEPDREEGSLTYDKDVLDQHSDPTSNSMDAKFSLASKLFYPDDKYRETKMETEIDLFQQSKEHGSALEKLQGASHEAAQQVQHLREGRS